MSRTYRLIGADGRAYVSTEPGTLGGFQPDRLYGLLDCWSARNAIVRGGYIDDRVFFADETTAIAAGYRPCAKCMPERYELWKGGGPPGTPEYPWLRLPEDPK